MKLLVIKPSRYISPSSFMEWQECNNKFYQSRLAGYPFIQTETGEWAGVGIAFDAYAKIALAKKFNISKPTITEQVLLEGIKCPDRNKLIDRGHKLWDYFENHGWPVKLPDKMDLELDRYKLFNNVPIYGKLDGSYIHEDNIVPFDFKVRAKSFTKGYSYRSSTGESDRVEFLEVDNERWAIQMLFYVWLLNGNEVTPDPIHCLIHEIKTLPTPELFIHDRYISPEFAKGIWDKLLTMWENISRLECEIIVPSPTISKCQAYGQLCKVAVLCPRYMEKLKIGTLS